MQRHRIEALSHRLSVSEVNEVTLIHAYHDDECKRSDSENLTDDYQLNHTQVNVAEYSTPHTIIAR